MIKHKLKLTIEIDYTDLKNKQVIVSNNSTGQFINSFVETENEATGLIINQVMEYLNSYKYERVL
jgi:hypothetical protein